jgi:hypothetical protein
VLSNAAGDIERLGDLVFSHDAAGRLEQSDPPYPWGERPLIQFIDVNRLAELIGGPQTPSQ